MGYEDPTFFYCSIIDRVLDDYDFSMSILGTLT